MGDEDESDAKERACRGEYVDGGVVELPSNHASDKTRDAAEALALGLFEEHEERNVMIVVWHVGGACLAFRRGKGLEGSLSAVE
jgi:hypothetical protein